MVYCGADEGKSGLSVRGRESLQRMIAEGESGQAAFQTVNLLDGIHPDAVDILKNKPITDGALKLFRKAKAVRQIDMAQLMVSGNNYSRAYAEALIVGTHADQLVDSGKPFVVGTLLPGPV